MQYIEKLRDNFDEMVVFKDLKKTNFFSALSLPAFMRDWLLRKFEDEDGNFDKDELSQFVKKFIPEAFHLYTFRPSLSSHILHWRLSRLSSYLLD